MSGLYKIRLQKGDLVMVRAGKDKGKTGTVSAVHRDSNKVTVKGVNVVTKHVKPDRQHPQGDKIQVERPIWVSKVSVVDPATKKATRISYKVTKPKTGPAKKVRIATRSGKEIVRSKA